MSRSTTEDIGLPSDRTAVIYDGDCPFCTRFVALQRFRETVGPVDLIDGRQRPDIAAALDRVGMDLDTGMVLAWRGELYHGDACIHRLALLSSGSGVFNRLNAAVFRSRTASRVLYPVLRTGRNLALWGLGRSRFSSQA